MLMEQILFLFFFSISIKPSKFLHKIKEEGNKRIGTEFINRNVNYDNLEVINVLKVYYRIEDDEFSINVIDRNVLGLH